jgi:hypothetical protein
MTTEATNLTTKGVTTMNTTRVWNLGYLAEMIGDADESQAAAMRDLLVDADLLTWTSDRDGGTLADVSDDVWVTLAKTAITG